MVLLIWLGFVLGYLLIGCLVFRMILVWYIDSSSDGYHQNDRDDLMEDLGWVLAGSLFWPITAMGYLFYKLIIKQLWHRPTPGERKLAEQKGKSK